MRKHTDNEPVREIIKSEDRRDVMSPQSAAVQGLAQTFGLDIRSAILAVLVDLMVFGGDTFSLETLLPLDLAP
jgi:hypothetical protein